MGGYVDVVGSYLVAAGVVLFFVVAQLAYDLIGQGDEMPPYPGLGK